MNETIIVQSNEITDLKLRLIRYETFSNYQMFSSGLDNDYGQNENERSKIKQSEESLFNDDKI